MDTCIVGKLPDKHLERQEYLTLNFAPTSAPQRQQRWYNSGLSADFLGDYFAAFFPGDPVAESAIDLKGTVKGAVSYIANELLENALKYSSESSNLPISITLYLEEREIVFQAINYADIDTAKRYRQFVEEIDSGDLDKI